MKITGEEQIKYTDMLVGNKRGYVKKTNYKRSPKNKNN